MEISDQAPSCPHCGCPSAEQSEYRKLQRENAKTVNSWNAIKIGIAGAVFTFLCCYLYGVYFVAAFFFGLLGFPVFALGYACVISYRIKKGPNSKF